MIGNCLDQITSTEKLNEKIKKKHREKVLLSFNLFISKIIGSQILFDYKLNFQILSQTTGRKSDVDVWELSPLKFETEMILSSFMFTCNIE